MCYFKKYILGLLSLVIIVGFSQAPHVKAMEETPYVTTEEGNIIEIGPPKIKTPSAKSLKNFNTNNLPINYKQIKSENTVTETISIAPSRYGSIIEIPFKFKNGEYLVLYQDRDGTTYNAVNMYNKDHNSIGVISTEVVNNLKKVKITSKIKGNDTLVLHVNSHDLSEALNIQVEITASTYSTYFSSGTWINRSGIESLSLIHNPYLTSANDFGEASVKKIDAWDKVVNVHGRNIKWSNTDGMKNQFDCHFDFAMDKNPWNLEPSRPNKSYFETVMASCNPR